MFEDVLKDDDNREYKEDIIKRTTKAIHDHKKFLEDVGEKYKEWLDMEYKKYLDAEWRNPKRAREVW